MTIKLALLKSGEEVISDIDEMMTDKKPVSIKLIPWLPLADEEKIPVVADWVISIVEPQPKLKELYTKACENYEKRKSESTSLSDTGNDSDTSGGSPE